MKVDALTASTGTHVFRCYDRSWLGSASHAELRTGASAAEPDCGGSKRDDTGSQLLITKGGDAESNSCSTSTPGVVRLEAVDPRLPWIHPVWTSGDYGDVRSIKQCRDENQASYGTNIGDVGWQPTATVSLSPNLRSVYKSCLGSNSFPQ